MEAKLVVFQNKGIRRTLHKGEWWFSVVDVCGVLTESPDAGAYWRKLKQRLKAEGSEVVTICHGLKLEAVDGKKYATDCANTEGIFRIIQSIPSSKAEPFKRWLAKVGYERVDSRRCKGEAGGRNRRKRCVFRKLSDRTGEQKEVEGGKRVNIHGMLCKSALARPRLRLRFDAGAAGVNQNRARQAAPLHD